MGVLRLIILIGLVSGIAGPAMAGKPDYCAAYARDFADARTKDKPIWQHKYEIALAACLAEPKKVEIAKPVIEKKPQVKAVVVEVVPPEPIIEQPVVPPPKKFVKLEPGSPEWNDYCTKKYTSFNVKTGMYLSKTGVERRCLVTRS